MRVLVGECVRDCGLCVSRGVCRWRKGAERVMVLKTCPTCQARVSPADREGQHCFVIRGVEPPPPLRQAHAELLRFATRVRLLLTAMRVTGGVCGRSAMPSVRETGRARLIAASLHGSGVRMVEVALVVCVGVGAFH